VNFAWTASNGDVGNSNEFWFTPPTRDGFLITLLVTDQFPQTVPMVCKVRVGKLPDFTGAGPLKDTICVNEQIPVFGGANTADTIGVYFPPGSFVLGGTFGGLLPLPDGSGVAYNTQINLSGFDQDALVTGPGDLASICINMEHSYLGDLEVWLECPTGQTVILFDAFTGNGQFPGGFAGGGTWLGDANDQGTGTPGIGFDYCFSSVNNTWGTMEQELANGNTVPVNSFAPPAGNAMNPDGVYLPQQGFENFIGCPLNGDWTLHIQDNLAQDDGYVFNWSLNFDANLLPDNESYQNFLVNDYWEDNPTIVSNQDTMILVSSNTPGTFNYTFVIEDNFGCSYDTTFTVFVKDPIVLNVPSEICFDTLALSSNTGFEDGMWIVYDSPAIPEFINDTDLNPTIVFPQPGVYNIAYNDLTCANGDSATVNLISTPYVQVGSDTMCIGEPFTLQAVFFDQNESYSWSTGETTQSISITQGGEYTITATNQCGSYSETAIITAILCDFEVPNVFSPNGDNNNDNFTLLFSDGMEEFNIVILNRWGGVIREFDQADFAWDGKDSSGNEVAEGVYFYKAIGTLFGGREIIKQGFVHLVRE
jgi:gliding motility-associated-like protein